MRAIFCFAGTVLSLSLAAAQTANPNPNNHRFDPWGNETSSCTIPPYQNKDDPFEPTDEMCLSSDVAFNLTDAHALAEAYAPVLFFHPLENFTMETVDATFRNESLGLIYNYANNKFLNVFSDLNQTSLLRTTRQLNMSMNNFEYFFKHDLSEEYTYGAGFNPDDGLSRAPIYYNVIETANNTWTFNYFFYYTFNGYSNLVSLSSYNGTESYTSFQLSPYGMHEGDWEGISVMVCRSSSASQPLAITYRQHAWSETNDCTVGDCHFYKDTLHVVGFSALSSHATYPVPTKNMVYSNVEVSFFVNLQGVLVVDRTAYLKEDNTFHWFYPNATNVIRIQDPEDIELGITDETNYWQGFAGKWGNSTKPTILPTPPDCLNRAQTEYIECPTQEEDPVFYLVMQLFGVYPPTSNVIELAADLSSQLVESFSETGSGPRGPVTKPHWSTWTPPLNAPLWNSLATDTTAEEYCKQLTEISDTYRLPVDPDTFDVKANVIAALALLVVLTVLTSLLILLSSVRKQHAPLYFDENGIIQKPTRRMWFQMHAPAFLFLFWYLVTVVGGISFGLGYDGLFNLLDKYVGGIDWGLISKFIMAMGIIVLIFDTALCVLIWLPSVSLWNKTMQRYHEMCAEDEEAAKYEKDPCNLSYKTTRTGFVVCVGFLFLSTMIAILMVVVGVAVVGFSYAFNELCERTIGSLGNVCVDLPFFDVDEIKCGADFVIFCNEWGDVNREATIWGAILIAIAHFYLVGASGAAYHQQTSHIPYMDTLPSSEKYQTSIKSVEANNDDSEDKKTFDAHQSDVNPKETDTPVDDTRKDDDEGADTPIDGARKDGDGGSEEESA